MEGDFLVKGFKELDSLHEHRITYNDILLQIIKNQAEKGTSKQKVIGCAYCRRNKCTKGVDTDNKK